MRVFGRVQGWCDNAELMRKLHGWAAVVWLAVSVPFAMLWGSSVLFVTWLSLYAIVTGHWSSWQSARVEVHQDEDADVQEVLNEVRRLRALIEGDAAP